MDLAINCLTVLLPLTLPKKLLREWNPEVKSVEHKGKYCKKHCYFDCKKHFSAGTCDQGTSGFFFVGTFFLLSLKRIPFSSVIASLQDCILSAAGR